jgi:hypothetical protein
MPDDVIGEVLVHPRGVASLEGREAFAYERDVGVLVMGHCFPLLRGR